MTVTQFKEKLSIKPFMISFLGLLLLGASWYNHDVRTILNSVVIVGCYSAFDLLWSYWQDRRWHLPTSAWISSLILSVIVVPTVPIVVLIMLPLLAVASKRLLLFGKIRHVFNPAAIALALMTVIMPVVAWWAPAAGSALSVPWTSPSLWLFICLLIGGAIIQWKQNRWHISLVFLASYAVGLTFLHLFQQVPLSGLSSLLTSEVAQGSVVFFATVMVIEPVTSTFATRRQEMMYAGLVGLAAMVMTMVASTVHTIVLDPLIFGLLTGNVIAGLLFLPERERTQLSYWFRAVPDNPRYPQLTGERYADVVIIGGGMAGISSAYFLSQSGLKVVLLEAQTIGVGDTGYTTACATRFLDSPEATMTAWEYSDAAISLLRKTITDEHLACDWQDVPAVCFSRNQDPRARQALKREAMRYQQKDPDMTFFDTEDATPLTGFPVHAAYATGNTEGIFHARKFVIGLAEKAASRGVDIFERSRVVSITPGAQVIVKTEKATVIGSWLVMATGAPSAEWFPLLAEKLRASVSYVLDVVVPEQTAVPAGFFWDDSSPYHYGRPVGDREWLIGGEDWIIEEPRSEHEPFAQLKQWIMKTFGITSLSIQQQWQGSLFTTADTLPLIGAHTAYGDNILFLTGWAGNGTAQGFGGGKMVADIVTGKENAFLLLFSCDRDLVWPTTTIKPRTTNHMELPENKGIIKEVDGKKVAVIALNGEVKAFSAVCPHMGCQIGWDDAEGSWECPCHGSRFTADGTLERGPATKGLTPVEVPKENEG